MRSIKRNHVLLATGAFAAGLVVALLIVREPMETLTPALLQQARQRWQDAEVRAYRVRYQMNNSAYQVEFRSGHIAEATVDGQPLLVSEPGMYTIDGLFDTLALDLENLSDPHGPFAGRSENILVRVRFNEDLGYVERYLRSSGGFGRGAVIELNEFIALEK